MLVRWGLACLLLLSTAAVARAHEFEDAFQKHLKAKNMKAVREDYLERMLKVRYRTQYYLEQFEKDLNRGLELADMESYANLNAMHPVRDEADEEALYVFKRACESAWKAKAQPESEAAAAIANEYFDWIRDRSEEDRILISDWIDDVEEASRLFDTEARATETKTRKVASVVPSFNFAQYNFGHQSNLSQIFRKHADEISKNASATLQWKDARVEESLKVHRFVKRKGRGVAATPLFRPSTGPEGNFEGDQMLPENFAFSFDDGPHPTVTDRVLDVALAHEDSINKGVPLTFFWLEEKVEQFPKPIDRVKQQNFPINNHSWTHIDFGIARKSSQFHKEVVDANQALRDHLGLQPILKSSEFPFYRCPYGSCISAHDGAGVPEVRKMIADLGLLHVGWRIDSSDWANTKTPDTTYRITIAQMEKTDKQTKQKYIDHGVILMHDRKKHTPDAFRMILDWIKQKNKDGAHITLVSVQEALSQANGASARSKQ